MRPSFWKWGLLLVGVFFLIDGFIPNSRAAAYDPWSGVGIALLMFLLFAFSCMVRLKEGRVISRRGAEAQKGRGCA